MPGKAKEVCQLCRRPREVFYDSTPLLDMRHCACCEGLLAAQVNRQHALKQPDVMELLALDSPKRTVIASNELIRNKLIRKFQKAGCKCYRCGHQIKRLHGYAVGRNKVKGIICASCFHRKEEKARATHSGLKLALRRMWLQPALSDNPYVQEILK